MAELEAQVEAMGHNPVGAPSAAENMGCKGKVSLCNCGKLPAKELDVLLFAGKLSASAVIERAVILLKDD
jgi:hypothetical protein